MPGMSTDQNCPSSALLLSCRMVTRTKNLSPNTTSDALDESSTSNVSSYSSVVFCACVERISINTPPIAITAHTAVIAIRRIRSESIRYTNERPKRTQAENFAKSSRGVEAEDPHSISVPHSACRSACEILLLDWCIFEERSRCIASRLGESMASAVR